MPNPSPTPKSKASSAKESLFILNLPSFHFSIFPPIHCQSEQSTEDNIYPVGCHHTMSATADLSLLSSTRELAIASSFLTIISSFISWSQCIHFTKWWGRKGRSLYWWACKWFTIDGLSDWDTKDWHMLGWVCCCCCCYCFFYLLDEMNSTYHNSTYHNSLYIIHTTFPEILSWKFRCISSYIII